MEREYYLVSDLHLGGDGGLQTCDYAAEFIGFLRKLALTTQASELILAGDTFGFWELTDVQGTAQMDEIVADSAAFAAAPVRSDTEILWVRLSLRRQSIGRRKSRKTP